MSKKRVGVPQQGRYWNGHEIQTWGLQKFAENEIPEFLLVANDMPEGQRPGGGFKYFLYLPLFGEDSHFD